MPSQGPTIAKSAQLGPTTGEVHSTQLAEYTQQTKEVFPALPFHPRCIKDPNLGNTNFSKNTSRIPSKPPVPLQRHTVLRIQIPINIECPVQQILCFIAGKFCSQKQVTYKQ